METYLTTNQVGQVLGISPVTVRAWHKQGRLVPTVQTPQGWRLYRKEDVERFAQERAEEKKEVR